MPLVAFVVLALLVQFFVLYSGPEPYPSVAMPGFEGITRLDDDPKLISVAYLRLESDGNVELLSPTQLFGLAPAGQRLRMMQRLDDMSGTAEEWAFLDSTAIRFDLGATADAAEVVRRDGYGAETLTLRIERAS